MKKSIFALAVAFGIVSVGCKAPAKKRTRKPAPPGVELPLVRANVEAPFNPDIEKPNMTESTYIDALASVIGNVELGENVYVAPFASIRGDEGQPLYIGDDSNVQDGVVLHALETINERGAELPGRTYEVNGTKYAVYVGKRVSMAHQSQVHGPAYIEDDVFVGMQALVFKAHVGRGSVIEPGAKVIGVDVPPGVYVRMGTVLNNQKDADKLPKIDEAYPFKHLNEAVVHVNTSFAQGYGDLLRQKPLKRDEHASIPEDKHGDKHGEEKAASNQKH